MSFNLHPFTYSGLVVPVSTDVRKYITSDFTMCRHFIFFNPLSIDMGIRLMMKREAHFFSTTYSKSNIRKRRVEYKRHC